MLDEAQRVPELFLALKAQVDRNRKPGRFILTGSANVLLLPKIADSLAGRMEVLTLWPLSRGEMSGNRETFLDAVFAPKLPTHLRGKKEARDMIRSQQRDAEKAEQEVLKTALGEERFKEYQMTQSWDYRQLARLAEQQGVPKENVHAVYQMKDDVQKAVREVNADKSLTPEARREKLIAIKAATEQQVTTTLGERGFKVWKREAWWMRSIVPPEPQK